MSPKSYRHNAVSNRFSSRFSTSRANGPRSLSRVKAGTHSAFREKSHTARCTPEQGPSVALPRCRIVPPAKYLVFRHAFIYIHFPVLCEPSLSAGGENPTKLPPQFYLKLFFNFSHKRPMFVFPGERAYTPRLAHRLAHSDPHAETGGVSDGALSLPSDRFARSGNPAWPGGRTAYFAAFGSWPGVLPKNAESLRDSDAHDARRCSEGVAAPLGCVLFFRFCRNYGFHTLRSRLSVCARGVVSLPSACFACCRNAGRPLVKMVYLPFSGVAEHHSLRGHFFC